jgi:2-oxoglutarate ferredoxin oxidoreductase subunit beta
MLGQKTTTSPPGRNAVLDGYPIKISEILCHLPGVKYVERCAVNNPANIMKAKKAIKKAIKYQIDGVGFSMIEILSQCPTNWKMSSIDSCKWIDEVMTKEYPLGVLKDIAPPTPKGGKARHDG